MKKTHLYHRSYTHTFYSLTTTSCATSQTTVEKTKWFCGKWTESYGAQIELSDCHAKLFFVFFFKCMNAKTKANALIKYEWKYTIINFAYSTIKFFARYLMKTCLETTLD